MSFCQGSSSLIPPTKTNTQDSTAEYSQHANPFVSQHNHTPNPFVSQHSHTSNRTAKPTYSSAKKDIKQTIPQPTSSRRKVESINLHSDDDDDTSSVYSHLPQQQHHHGRRKIRKRKKTRGTVCKLIDTSTPEQIPLPEDYYVPGSVTATQHVVPEELQKQKTKGRRPAGFMIKFDENQLQKLQSNQPSVSHQVTLDEQTFNQLMPAFPHDQYPQKEYIPDPNVVNNVNPAYGTAPSCYTNDTFRFAQNNAHRVVPRVHPGEVDVDWSAMSNKQWKPTKPVEPWEPPKRDEPIEYKKNTDYGKELKQFTCKGSGSSPISLGETIGSVKTLADQSQEAVSLFDKFLSVKDPRDIAEEQLKAQQLGDQMDEDHDLNNDKIVFPVYEPSPGDDDKLFFEETPEIESEEHPYFLENVLGDEIEENLLIGDDGSDTEDSDTNDTNGTNESNKNPLSIPAGFSDIHALQNGGVIIEDVILTTDQANQQINTDTQNMDIVYEDDEPVRFITIRNRPNTGRPSDFRETVGNLNAFTVVQLKEMCRKQGLPCNGNKSQLVERLS